MMLSTEHLAKVAYDIAETFKGGGGSRCLYAPSP
jgi:hypothetical protein